MPSPLNIDKSMRLAVGLALVGVVIFAPLIGVYALSPLIFVWLLQPYPLALAVSVMMAEAVTIAALVFLAPRKR